MQKIRDNSINGRHCNLIVYDDADSPSYGKIVADMCVDKIHSHIISTYDQLFDGEYKLVLRDEDPEELYLELTDGNHFWVVIEDGRWYTVE